MVVLYWNIGKKIREEVLLDNRAEYGQEVVKELSDQLRSEFGKGFSKRNLFNMIKFYDVFSNEGIVQTLSAQLSWSHFVELIRIEDHLKVEFYATISVNERWSVRVLKERINSMLYERTALSKKPDQTISNDLAELMDNGKMSTDLFLRDPYVLDFLELQDTYSEKDLENAILAELESFMFEFGREFTFVGRQQRITIGDRDYYIDLLFYHRKLKRLVLTELKLGEFKPEYKGQVELYLRWLDKNEKNEGEESPIGIILCAEKSQETVELLELDKSGIHVAQYLTQLPPKEVLEKKLHKAIERAKYRLNEK
ncbi:PDDEXK nuclease domain-containing protein [Fusibacter ferrireducens]|uniref:PDDEXK nuclease domain-containing protein n=1 Tax=Fusibacter ferrireducens TaxID=2785058 RepID=UPI001A9BBC93|nr:PDDEXK nuclease domain-containing protein [Fusibacter ferrireducens]